MRTMVAIYTMMMRCQRLVYSRQQGPTCSDTKSLARRSSQWHARLKVRIKLWCYAAAGCTFKVPLCACLSIGSRRIRMESVCIRPGYVWPAHVLHTGEQLPLCNDEGIALCAGECFCSTAASRHEPTQCTGSCCQKREVSETKPCLQSQQHPAAAVLVPRDAGAPSVTWSCAFFVISWCCSQHWQAACWPVQWVWSCRG